MEILVWGQSAHLANSGGEPVAHIERDQDDGLQWDHRSHRLKRGSLTEAQDICTHSRAHPCCGLASSISPRCGRDMVKEDKPTRERHVQETRPWLQESPRSK